MTNTPKQMVTRPDPSTHWSENERFIVLRHVAHNPGQNGVYLVRHSPRSIKRMGMALHQFEVEGLLEYGPVHGDDPVWSLTDAGRAFLVVHP